MRISLTTLILILVLFGNPTVSNALTPLPSQDTRSNGSTFEALMSAFRYSTLITPKILVPTVVEVAVDLGESSMPVFAVRNLTTGVFESYFIKDSTSTGDGSGPQVVSDSAVGNTLAIRDGNYQTYLEWPLRAGANEARITFTFDKPVTASSLSFALDNNVARPQTVSVEAYTATGSYTALATTRLQGNSVSFPKTTAKVWNVTFNYVQPLRITEMSLDEFHFDAITARSVRFLAQPGQEYQLYYGADRYIAFASNETGDLRSDKGVVAVSSGKQVVNSYYKPADADKDSIPDITDNCASVVNTDQKDSDSNGRGDACEDYDRDYIIAASDNCPDLPNQNQLDTDNDGIGDVCDDYEDRVTERLPWLPWVGIGIAGLVVLGLFVLTFSHKKKEPWSATSSLPNDPPKA